MSDFKNEHIKVLTNLYSGLYKHQPDEIVSLPKSGSSRQYFRLTGSNNSVIGAYNADVNENVAFFSLSRHFLSKGLNVPNLLSISENQQYYLISDLGDTTLYSSLSCHLANSEYNEKMMGYFKSSLSHLVRFQIDGADGLDFSKCYPKQIFDRRSVMWDFNYFKYSFLKPTGVIFDEEKLEDDFESFANYLLDDEMVYFHYRDFQSRNIMVKDNELFFIDYQGGRKGPCLYDVASFLYQAKASIPQSQKDLLFDFYLAELSSKKKVDVNLLKKRFPAFVLFRVIQTLGAYGYRGYFEGKAHFLQSIPPAIENIAQILKSDFSDLNINYLSGILHEVVEIYRLRFEQTELQEGLTIDITSFSLKNGYPTPNVEHGGGFIFDCRALQNPGRLAKYKELTGLDSPVAEYLKARPEVDIFMNNAYELIRNAVENYTQRGFKYISVGFGCTGGQHRSVYCANRLADMLKDFPKVNIRVSHRELNRK
ncbi:MAG: phosphotransferase [Bacteroidales bacterium]|nr:phosphotransferase [Bacteroidales bacterium]